MEQTKLYDESCLLFVRPSFRRGVVRVIAPLGRIVSYNFSPNPTVADARAIRSDWRAVGRSILGSTRKYASKAMR